MTVTFSENIGIVVFAAFQIIIACAAVEQIGAYMGIEFVVAVAAIEFIVGSRFVAVIGFAVFAQDVIAVVAINGVMAVVAAVNFIVACIAMQDVITVSADKFNGFGFLRLEGLLELYGSVGLVVELEAVDGNTAISTNLVLNQGGTLLRSNFPALAAIIVMNSLQVELGIVQAV